MQTCRVMLLIKFITRQYPDVVQFGSTLALGARGREFKSLHPDQLCLNKRNDFMYSTLDNLNIDLKQNKDGTYNIRDLRRYRQAEFVKSQIKYFNEWDKVYLHHSALHSGYVSRSRGCYIRKYNGRFGVGYVVDIPNFGNTKQFERRYYIFKKNFTKKYLAK